MDLTTLSCLKSGGAATITLNKPETYNAMDMVMRVELFELLTDLSKDDEVGAVVLTGAGKAFCSGGDLSTMGNSAPNAGRKRMQHVQRVTRAIMEMEKPVVAAINGPCTGSGMALARSCDIAIASDQAKFGQAFLKIGLVPDLGTFYLLPRIVGLRKAKEMALLSEMMDAQAALACGLVNKVCPHESLNEEVEAVVRRLCRGPRVAQGLAKQLLNKSFELDYERTLLEEAMAQDICMLTEDFQEGLAAFKERRHPVFKGR